jgi:hypothetical protein
LPYIYEAEKKFPLNTKSFSKMIREKLVKNEIGYVTEKEITK